MKRAALMHAEELKGASKVTPSGRGAHSSFRRRLALRMMLLCVAILATSLLVVFFAVEQALWLNLDRMLLSIARSEIASSMDGPQGRVHTHDEASMPLDLSAGAGYEKFGQIMDRSGTIVAQTRNVASGPGLSIDNKVADMAWTQGSLLGDVWRDRELYRGLYYRMQDREGKQYLAIIALSRKPVWQLLRSLALVLFGTLAVAGAASVVVSFKLAAHLTRPLQRIAAAASSVQEADLSVRIPEVSKDAELQDVTVGLNSMLGRLEAAFEMRQQMLGNQRRFTADASHELRTPLTNLQGHLEVALRRPRSAEEYQHSLAVALSETRRMARLVADLLTLSRADADLLRLKQRPCDLAEIAAQSACAFRNQAERTGTELSLEGSNKLMIVADPERLRQVIDNLLDNALRYAPSGSKVSLTLCEENGEARLSVIDSGPGLTTEEQPRVFERFYRTDASRTSESGGTGLGLSIAKAIVEAHRGRIEVRSNPGIMTAFTIALKQEGFSQQNLPRDGRGVRFAESGGSNLIRG